VQADVTVAGPIAKKVLRSLKKAARAKVVDIDALRLGRDEAEEFQRTVATPDGLAGLHPEHAVYVHAYNQLSVLTEQLTALDELARFVTIISAAEDDYLPVGPPMSPLTGSFFNLWASFDIALGLARETLGTTAIAVGTALGVHRELLRLFRLMQQSRMGVYLHEGADGDVVMLRELVTGTMCRAIVPAGYGGGAGELWYVRLLPPPLPDSKHVAFTTPYVLLEPGETAWQEYFRRTLPEGGPRGRTPSYEQHMKYGPQRTYWTEFVFEAYVNHQVEAIFLAGLPDVADSRPHSRARGG